MKTELFFINALSNLHVGSGDVNYGLVDNLIQRDPVTHLPTIHSSSLKGALRDHFENVTDITVDIKHIFGSKPKDKDQDRAQGNVRFFEADLVAIPARCTGATFPYVMVTAQNHLQRLSHRLEILGIKAQFLTSLPAQQQSRTQVTIEDLDTDVPVTIIPKEMQPYLDEHIAIVDESIMDRLCDDEHLPVISRNCLEDGQSTNLFYEQVLPRYSRLCTILMGEGTAFDSFCESLNGQLVQIGGNATIGYGYCLFTRFTPNNTPKQ